MMIAPQQIIQNDPTPEVLAAVRALLVINPCAVHFGAEAISRLLHLEHYLPYPVSGREVDRVLEVLRIDGEVVA
jgi:hypothetical protein